MAIILSIETSTVTSSIAIHDEGVLMASLHVHLTKSHSEHLVPTIKHLLEVCGKSSDDIHAIAVSKGLCYGLNARLIAINTLEAMAFGIAAFSQEDTFLCPMIDARRMEVYCMILDKELKILQPTQALVIDENSFSEYLSDHRIVFFGNGADKCRAALRHQPNAIFLDGIHPNAEHIGTLAWRHFQHQYFEDVATFEPYYLKDFIAKKPSAPKLV